MIDTRGTIDISNPAPFGIPDPSVPLIPAPEPRRWERQSSFVKETARAGPEQGRRRFDIPTQQNELRELREHTSQRHP